VDAVPRPTLRSALARIVRLRCPRCGRGRVFAKPFVRAETCESCAWRYERGQGHWVGGSEVHMFLSYGISVVVCVPFLVIFGASLAVKLGVILGHVLVSVGVFHFSRSAFLGIDFLIDPGEPEARDGDDPGGETPPAPPRPRTPKGATRRRRKVRIESGSERPREPVDA